MLEIQSIVRANQSGVRNSEYRLVASLFSAIEYVNNNRMKFGVGHFYVDDLCLHADELMIFTRESFAVVSACLLMPVLVPNSIDETMCLLKWANRVLSSDGWLEQSDFSDNERKEILDIILKNLDTLGHKHEQKSEKCSD